MKRIFRKHKRLVITLLLFISIGFAYLSTQLDILGNTLLKANTWDVHFENVQVSDGSVTSTDPVIDTNRTSVTFSAVLNKPGDYYEFTVDAVNGGTIDAMISTITDFNLTESQKKYLETSVTYEDGEEIKAKQQLLSGDTAVYKIKVSYKKDLSAVDLPEEVEEATFTYTVTYVQRDNTAIERRAETYLLYNVLKREALNGGLAKKYTGDHQDSMDASKSTKDIYHWHASNSAEGTSVTNKMNVIFANHCWQMIRTTDTGGVKLLYNGEAIDNKCLSNRSAHVGYDSSRFESLGGNYWYGTDYIFDNVSKTFKLSGETERSTCNETTIPNLIGKYTCKSSNLDGSCETLYFVESYYPSSGTYVFLLNSKAYYYQYGALKYNISISSPAYVGYMYNTAYEANYKYIINSESVLSKASLSTSYWYAHNVSWTGSSVVMYTLENPYQITSTDDYTNLIGEYTLRGTNQYGSSSVASYIVDVNESDMYYIPFNDSTAHDLASYNFAYTFGDSYTYNDDGTYTLNNTITINRLNWLTDYSNIGEKKYVCKNAVNNSCLDLWYITKISNMSIEYVKVSNNYKYSNNFVWDGNKYVLNDDSSVSFWNISDKTNLNKMNNAHYTCWNATGECSTLSYVYNTYDEMIYYINLTGGRNVEEALNEMLYSDDVNSTNSNIKSGVDAWYKHFLLEKYDTFVEDTIFCNDRSTLELNGWNPNGGSIFGYLKFNQYKGKGDLSCSNITDQFSISNPKAKLTYKVGLISYPEMILSSSYSGSRESGKCYWLGTPFYFGSRDAYVTYVYSGTISNSSVFGMTPYDGVRPAISLKPGIYYSSGNGSLESPYIIDTN